MDKLENQSFQETFSDLETIALNANRKKKKRIIKIIIFLVIGCFFSHLIGKPLVLSTRRTYDSASAMKSDLQGKYTHYSDNGNALWQIEIKGDRLRYIFGYLDIDSIWTDIEWFPELGKFDALGDFIVTKDGNLKENGNLYKKGGSMTIGSSFSDSSSYLDYESGYSVLKITVDGVTTNSSYTICTGSVKNTGKETYKFVEVKGAFKDYSGNVVDTDWTYAVGSEGLAPGESSTFRLSVPKNATINRCSVSILDFN